MKRFVTIFAAFVFAFSLKVYEVQAEETKEQIVGELTEKYADFFEDALLTEENQKNNEGFLDFDAEKIIKNASVGKSIFSPKELFLKIVQKFFAEAALAAKATAAIMAVSLAGAFLLSPEDGGASQAARLCIYTVCSGITVSIFSKACEVTVSAVGNLSLFLKAVFPVLTAALYSAGCISSAAVLQPAVTAVIQISVHIIEKVFIPVITVSFAVCSVNMLSKEVNADKLVAFLLKSVKTCLAAMLIIFMGIVGLEAMAASSADGISVKLTKFAASNLVPVVGGILSEAVETVMGCSAVIKNSAGICGICAIAYISASPLLKLGAGIAVLKASAAVLEPVADKRITKCIWDLSDTVSMLFATVASVAVMFILITAVIINTGNRAVITGM